ncbi:hypothetical protein M434DRAFT_367846 [Hypoxylon sp. CO27-5]|nr:hypothetical protein M434DRAFT_367846 [Hypoxylon sp. CO27-5]
MARRRPSLVTAVAKLVTSAGTVPRALAPWAARADPRSVTSVARLATLHATAPMHSARTTTEAETSMVAVTVVEDRPERRATLVVATVTCLASASTAVSATTAARMATSLATVLRLLLEARRFATSASSLDTSKLSALTKPIYNSPPWLFSDATIR